MIDRILEPEVMDSADEARDYDTMDHSQVNRVFVADLLKEWRVVSGELRVGSSRTAPDLLLDVGAGTAQIPIELCRQHATVRVLGIDLAEHMLAVGRTNVHKAGLDGRIELQRVDAKKLPFSDGHFQAIISNSIVHHIPQPGAVLAEMLRVLAPGGIIFVRDLLRPDSERRLQDLVELYAGDANAHQRQMFADSLHAALTLAEVRSLVVGFGFDPESVQQTSDRHWTWSGRRSEQE